MDVRRVKLHDVAKKDCASRQRTWVLWIGRNTVGGENVKNRLPRPCTRSTVRSPTFQGRGGEAWLRVNLEPLGLSSGRRQAPIFGSGSREVHWFTWVIAATGVLQGGLFTGKSAGCSAFLPVGRGGEGGNGLPQWSQSRPCNHNYISRKPRPLGR